MFHRTCLAQATFFGFLKDLASWSRGSAAAQLAETPSSDTPPAQFSTAELRRIQKCASSSSPGPSSASSSSSFSKSIWGGRAKAAAPRTAASIHEKRSPVDLSTIGVESDDFDVEALLNSVEAVVYARRSTKVFDETRPVDRALLQRLLTATTRSPTGNNLQPWHAIVVEDAAQKEALCRAALGQRQVLTAPYTVIFAADTEVERYAAQALEQGLESGSFGANYGPGYLRSVFYHVHGGPCQSMAIAKNVVSSWYSRQTGTPLLTVPLSREGYAWKQCMIPATVFLHLATAAGLDSCVMEGIDEAAVKAVVGLPERFTVPVIIPVGHALPGDGFGGPRRPRTPRFAVHHLIRWGTY